jgi:hypothetical protein
MATGTGNLPYPMPPVSPFDVITSQAENERIANIESLADGTGVGDGAVTAAKIDFTTFSPTTSNGWTVSADGRVATKRLSTTGFQTFGSAGSTNWLQSQSIGAFPAGFTAADCTVSITRIGGTSTESLIAAGVQSTKTNFYMANTSNQSGIGNTGTVWVNDIMLVRKN